MAASRCPHESRFVGLAPVAGSYAVVNRWHRGDVGLRGLPPAESSGEVIEFVLLANDRRLRIRHLRRGEEHTIRELWDHLSPRSRYLRFLSMMPALPDSLLRSLAWVDDRRRLALVAERGAGMGGEVVGLASFAADDDDNAEVGLVVRDDWQSQRVGTELATRLLQAAERRGFRRFIAYVVPENTAVRRLLRNVGIVVSSKVSQGVCEIAFVRRTP